MRGDSVSRAKAHFILEDFMVVAGDFRNGITFEMDGGVYQIIEFQHVKPGKGAAFVRTKLKNVISGAVVEKTFNPTDKFCSINNWQNIVTIFSLRLGGIYFPSIIEVKKFFD